MTYTVKKAELLAEQLRRFETGYAHHVAGQFANLDFWMGEVESALAAIDGHKERFGNLSSGQQSWVQKHRTQVPVGGFCGLCRGRCEFDDGSQQSPTPPKRKGTTKRTSARRELVDASYHLLTRLYRMGLLDEKQLRDRCEQIGTSIEPSDIASNPT